MSRRRINPDTGEPEFTYRERMFIGEYIKNGGNGKDAAIAAGYGPAHADQSAPPAQNADPRAETSRPSPSNPQPRRLRARAY